MQDMNERKSKLFEIICDKFPLVFKQTEDRSGRDQLKCLICKEIIGNIKDAKSAFIHMNRPWHLEEAGNLVKQFCKLFR